MIQLTSFAQNPKYNYALVQKMPYGINSDAEESKPIVSPDGNAVYFARTFHPKNIGGTLGGQDIWYIRKDLSGFWNNPVNDKSLNTKDNNGIIGISEDGKTLFLLNTYKKKDRNKASVSFSTRILEEWQSPIGIRIPKIKNYGESHDFFMNQKASVLIISMNSDSTLGHEDLYVTFLSEEGWSQPAHMGKVINSAGFEFAPFLTDDDKTLYFCSDGHNGYGDSDIYMSRRLDDTYTNWSKPVNLGPSINSRDFDAYFTLDRDNNAYFCSNRDGGFSAMYSAKRLLPGQRVNDVTVAHQNVAHNNPVINNGGENPNNNNYQQSNTNQQHTDNQQNSADRSQTLPPLNEDDFTSQETGNHAKTSTKIDEDRPRIPTSGTFANEGKTEEELKKFSDLKLLVYDAKGNLLTTAYMDNDGKFVLEEIPTDEEYVFKLEGEDPDVPELDIVFKSDEGSFVMTVDKAKIEEFDFKYLPSENIGITLMAYEYEGDMLDIGMDDDGVITHINEPKSNLSNQSTNGSGINESVENNNENTRSGYVEDSNEKSIPSSDKKIPTHPTDKSNLNSTFPENVSGSGSEQIENLNEYDSDLAADLGIDRTDREKLKALIRELIEEILDEDEKGPIPKERIDYIYARIEELLLGDGIQIAHMEEDINETTTLDENGERKPVIPRADQIKYVNLPPAKTIYFGFNAYSATADHYPVFKTVLARMKTVSSLKIRSYGYGDNIGTKEGNELVSYLRAQGIMDYLIRNGIAKNRIDVKGYGAQNPAASNSTEEGRSQNRRVEIEFFY